MKCRENKVGGAATPVKHTCKHHCGVVARGPLPRVPQPCVRLASVIGLLCHEATRKLAFVTVRTVSRYLQNSEQCSLSTSDTLSLHMLLPSQTRDSGYQPDPRRRLWTRSSTVSMQLPNLALISLRSTCSPNRAKVWVSIEDGAENTRLRSSG